jgi:3-deoxy-manno-octulosonate cytidylyltransferase (CMP-KDO synthetase)
VNEDAIYFSRYCLPYERDGKCKEHFKHVGVYGYKTSFLKKYSKMPKTSLEIAESLEQLRVIENGLKIKVKETIYQTIGVDTPEQIELVEKELEKEREKI